MIRIRLILAGLLICACASAHAQPADPFAERRPITWRDLLERPRETADHRIAYGRGEQEFGELWLPQGDGPFPLVIMIHGGCWLAEIPGTILQDQMAAALRSDGVAVWNLEYARLGHATGGYPGTFADIAAGVDHVRALADAYALDLTRTVVTGHSAGGHLALWAAARGNLPEDSALDTGEPFIPNGVVTLAGINDLADYRAHGPGRCGEPETVDRLLEGAPDGGGDASPAQLLPIGVPQTVISGAIDPIVPAVLGERYVLLARDRGDATVSVVLPEAGHFELIDPTAPAWGEIRAALLERMSPPAN